MVIVATTITNVGVVGEWLEPGRPGHGGC
jgi:hypothetical protein